MFNFISIIVGVAAWVLGCLAVASKASRTSYGLSVASFFACVLALLSQFLEIGKRGKKDEEINCVFRVFIYD